MRDKEQFEPYKYEMSNRTEEILDEVNTMEYGEFISVIRSLDYTDSILNNMQKLTRDLKKRVLEREQAEIYDRLEQMNNMEKMQENAGKSWENRK